MNKPVVLDELFEKNAPGVYRAEYFAPRPSAFLTGVPVFIGLAKNAEELLKPKRLHFWPQFEMYIGKLYQDCALGYAVRGFFQNGGKQCCVVPLSEITQKSLADGLKVSAVLDVDLVCAPDLGNVNPSTDDAKAMIALQQTVVKHCEDMGDRFAILDSQVGADGQQVGQQWSDIDGMNGAIYYPWIKVHGFHRGTVPVPPCGHVAGVYARTDETRGLHKAPANEVLEGVIDLERHVTNREQDDLNPQRVNCLRSFPGRGIRVWGARTLSGHYSWTYVNVRRLFLTAVRWMERYMSDVTFEPNDAKLWARIEQELNSYFLDLYRRGALKGDTPQEAFFVNCNKETNPKEVVDLGQVIAEIGLAPAIPYEFVVVRLIYGRSGVRISGPNRPEQTDKE